MKKKYHLFEVFGIELEYMLVKTSTLQINPVVDQLFIKKNGAITSDINNGEIAWSNELVAHVVELKTNGPAKGLEGLSELFHQNIIEINALLAQQDTKLMPSAAHPLMNPLTETTLWKHSYSEVYELYNRIFDCKGHGWSNVQSTHINLPFYDDLEFEQLHAAIRIILPILPGLCASSPILDGKNTGFKDTRLEYYKINQKEIPEMTGLVIPERVFTKKDYHRVIFEPIKKAIQPYDTTHILDHNFLNSRGAIARFDRNAIEIRLIDVQECPKADLAICALIIEVLKFIVMGNLAPLALQKKYENKALFAILNSVIKEAENHLVKDLSYLKLFGLQEKVRVKDIWAHLYELTKHNIHPVHQQALDIILTKGTLSSRILFALNDNFAEENIIKTYTKLTVCLEQNILFEA